MKLDINVMDKLEEFMTDIIESEYNFLFSIEEFIDGLRYLVLKDNPLDKAFMEDLMFSGKALKETKQEILESEKKFWSKLLKGIENDQVSENEEGEINISIRIMVWKCTDCGSIMIDCFSHSNDNLTQSSCSKCEADVTKSLLNKVIPKQQFDVIFKELMEQLKLIH